MAKIPQVNESWKAHFKPSLIGERKPTSNWQILRICPTGRIDTRSEESMDANERAVDKSCVSGRNPE